MEEIIFAIVDQDGDGFRVSYDSDQPNHLTIEASDNEAANNVCVMLSIKNAKSLRSFLGTIIGQYEIQQWDKKESGNG